MLASFVPSIPCWLLAFFFLLSFLLCLDTIQRKGHREMTSSGSESASTVQPSKLFKCLQQCTFVPTMYQKEPILKTHFLKQIIIKQQIPQPSHARSQDAVNYNTMEWVQFSFSVAAQQAYFGDVQSKTLIVSLEMKHIGTSVTIYFSTLRSMRSDVCYHTNSVW